MISRRRFLATVGLIGLGGASLPAYARYVEPRLLRLTRKEVRLPSRGRFGTFRLLHLSDFHLSEYVSLSHIERSIRMGLAEKPDLICVTGDFVTKRCDVLDEYRRVLSALADKAPTYACLGNHDGGGWSAVRGGYRSHQPVRDLLKASGITCLWNEGTRVTAGGLALELVGLGDVWARDIAPNRAFREMPDLPEAPRIVLTHNPDSKSDVAAYAWDLMLCGHTHGGQLYVPFVGAPFAPVKDARYVEGLNPWKDRWIHTTRGIGNVRGIRFNCPPEVSILDVSV
jgi:predicted MPP superfamily phosphohydrolase